MKKILLLFLCVPLLCGAQTKVKQYIRVFIPPTAFGSSSISGSDEYSAKQLEPIMQGESKLKFKSDTECLNYLSQHGWELVPFSRLKESYFLFVRDVEITEENKVKTKKEQKD